MSTAYLTRTAGCLLLGVLFLLTGCADFTRPAAPNVTLADIQVMEMKSLETTFLVDLRITNPNPEPLIVEGLNCDVELEGHQFASGLQRVEQTIPAYSSTLVPMEVYASMLDMFTSVLNLLQSANEPGNTASPIGYRITGNVRIKNGSFAHTLPFTSEGEMRL